MKKNCLILILGLLFIPIFVNAANPKVTSLKVSSDGYNIKYSGITENGSHAVMCKLFDKDSNEIDQLSSAVDNKQFKGELLANEDGSYTLSCANYEGGDFNSVNVTISTKEEKSDVNIKNPKTIDNILIYLGIALIAVIGIISTKIYFKKKIK